MVLNLGLREQRSQLAECEPCAKLGSALVTQACRTLCDPMDCSPPGSSVHGIFQARIMEWVAISFSRESWVTWILILALACSSSMR